MLFEAGSLAVTDVTNPNKQNAKNIRPTRIYYLHNIIRGGGAFVCVIPIQAKWLLKVSYKHSLTGRFIEVMVKMTQGLQGYSCLDRSAESRQAGQLWHRRGSSDERPVFTDLVNLFVIPVLYATFSRHTYVNESSSPAPA